MGNLNFWELFTETGDPLCWLYCRAEEKSEDKAKATED